MASVGVDYLNQEFPQDAFDWKNVVWPLTVCTIAYTYYMIMRAIIRAERRANQKNDAGGGT